MHTTRFRILPSAFTLFSALVLFTSCATSSQYAAMQAKSADRSTEAGDSGSEAKDRLLIRNAWLNYEVEEVGPAVEVVSAKAEQLGGYLEGQSGNRFSYRIPAAQLDAFLASLDQGGKVNDLNISVSDITNSYRDMEIRLQNAKKVRERYLALLDKAETVTDMLAVEKELERIQAEIEVMEGQIARWDKQVGFSTVSINFKERIKPGPLGYVFYGAYKAVAWLFVRNPDREK